MSNTSRGESVSKKIQKAYSDTVYWKLEESGDDKPPTMKSKISLGGALTNQWKDDNEMFYWPQFRLAASDTGTLYTFAAENGLIKEVAKGKPVEFGPLIGKSAESGEKAVPAAFMVTISMDGKSVKANDQEVEDLMIPMYDITLESSKKKETVKSEPYTKTSKIKVGPKDNEKTMTFEKEYSAADYFTVEKDMVKAVKSEKTTKTSQFSFADMEDFAYGSSSDSDEKKSSKKKSSKAKSEVTLKDLVKRIDEYRSKNSEKNARMDITKLSKTLTNGTIRKKGTSNHVYALPSDHQYYDYFMLNKSLASDQSPENFYLLFTDSEDEAVKMLKNALKAEDLVEEVTAKATSGKKSTKSPITKRVVDDDEEEKPKKKTTGISQAPVKKKKTVAPKRPTPEAESDDDNE